ncbi:hypothetical protein NMY22_g15734 [Coprinellus aureogranulatus]|nr:hypothetical protein NMY22_g15734 [Coprinellus aureogranulatus]
MPSATINPNSSKEENSPQANPEVSKGLTLMQFKRNLLAYLQALKVHERRAIYHDDGKGSDPSFDPTPTSKYPGGRLTLNRAFYEGFRCLLKRGCPWPTVQEICAKFGVSKEELAQCQLSNRTS